MKTFATFSSLALIAALSANPAAADERTDKEKLAGMAKFSAGALVGGLVGGPVGMIVGGVGGGLFADQDDEMADTESQLGLTRLQVSQLEREVAMQEAKILELEEDTLARMELKVFFDTGIDQVTDLNRQRVKAVADYLADKPELHVRLDGHADPRGTDEYNNVLAHERALTVRKLLLEEGIAEKRIRLSSHGSDKSTASSGDVEEYARDRRVDIRLEFAPANAISQARF